MLVFSMVCIGSCNEDPIKIKPPDNKNNFQTSENLDKMWHNIQANLKGTKTEDICEFLVEVAAKNWSQDRISTTLKLILSLQIKDESNPYFGNFLWSIGESIPSTQSSFDINGALFSGTHLTLLRLKFYNQLDTLNKSILDDIVSRILVALNRDIDSRRASYTNTWAMRTWVLCGLGEATNDLETLEAGKLSLHEWMQNVNQNGLVEYNSGVYGQVTARALGCLANLIKDNEIYREANILLKYFSRLYFGNFVSFDDRGMVYGGPQSRNYNFVHSKGGSDIFYRIFTGKAQGFFNSYAAWPLFVEDKALYNTRPKVILYKNGITENHYVVHYVGSKISMGSSGVPYGAEDKTFVINLFDNTRPSVVHISSIFEGRSDPYGENQVSVGNGSKPRHLVEYLLARSHRIIENGSEMVFMISGDGSDRGDTKILNHYTIIPADRHDGVWNGNTNIQSLQEGAVQVLSQEDNNTLFIRFGDAAIGIRYLKVLNVQGEDVISNVRLVNTPNKTQSISAGTAMYLQAQLSMSKPDKGSNALVAVWWKVMENLRSEEEFQQFRTDMINTPVIFSQIGNVCSVKITTQDGELGVAGDISSKLQIANYGGLTQPDGVLTVDNEDLTRKIFGESQFFYP